MAKTKRIKVNKAVLVGDSWKLPRMKWMDGQAKGNKGDKGYFSVMGDVGIHLRAKGEEGEGVKVQPYTQEVVECNIGEKGMVEVFLSGAPLNPAPRIGIQVAQTLLITKEKGKEELVPTIDEAKKVERAEIALEKIRVKAEKAAKQKVKEEIEEEKENKK